jgi:hypothetical protein
MHKLIGYIYFDFDTYFLRNKTPDEKLTQYKSENDFVNEVSLENKTPIQIAIENLNIGFFSIFVSVVDDRCFEEYNALLQEQTLTMDPNYDQNLREIFQQKAAKAIEEIDRINTELPSNTDKEKKLKQLEIFNVIYGLFRIALLTNDSDTQITIIQNIIDVIEDQKLIDYPEVNFTENDIFTKISLTYFNYRNVADSYTYEEAKTEFENDDYDLVKDLETYDVKDKSDKISQSSTLSELVKEALPQRSTYLASKGDYEKVAIYYFKNISKILEENSGTLLRSPDPALIKQDAMDPRLVVFSTPMSDIFRNFPDLEKGKEEFQSSLQKYAEETNAIKVLAIFTGGVIEKVYEQIKQERDLKSNPQQSQIQEQATLSTQNVAQTNLSSNPQDSGPSQAIASSTILSQQLSSNQSLLGKRKRAGSCPL